MTFASSWFRRVEIALWVLGISLVGAALVPTLSRWHYQSQQERALFDRRGPALSVTPAAPSSSPAAPTVYGPDPPATPPIAMPADRVAAPAPSPAKKRHPAALDPTALGRIEIPRLGVTAIVKEGGDEETLSRAVGLVPGSPHPGDLGNVVLAGHRDTFFRPLRRIKVNDRIRVSVPPNTYEYVVQSLRVVPPEETSVLESNGVEELTLVTCYPFNLLGPAPDRFIVRAARVN